MENMNLNNTCSEESPIKPKDALVAERLKALRFRAGFSTETVADVLGVSRVLYEMVEKRITPINPAWIPHLARFYGVPEEKICKQEANDIRRRYYVTAQVQDGSVDASVKSFAKGIHGCVIDLPEDYSFDKDSPDFPQLRSLFYKKMAESLPRQKELLQFVPENIVIVAFSHVED